VPGVQLTGDVFPWVSAAAIAWGLLDCFCGYRVFKVTLALVGGLLGMAAGQAAGAALGLGHGGEIGAVVAGGLLGAGLSFLLYIAAVFVAGFGFGCHARCAVALALHQMVALLSGCVMGIIGGFFAVKLQRVLIMLSTSLLGAFRAILALRISPAGSTGSTIPKPPQISRLDRQQTPGCFGHPRPGGRGRDRAISNSALRHEKENQGGGRVNLRGPGQATTMRPDEKTLSPRFLLAMTAALWSDRNELLVWSSRTKGGVMASRKNGGEKSFHRAALWACPGPPQVYSSAALGFLFVPEAAEFELHDHAHDRQGEDGRKHPGVVVDQGGNLRRVLK